MLEFIVTFSRKALPVLVSDIRDSDETRAGATNIA
jgi:hypothetical protein